LRVLG